MNFNLFNDFLLPVFSSIISSGIVLFILRSWIAKRIEHNFNEKIESFKSDLVKEVEVLKAELAKQNIGYQSHQVEYAKKKFSSISSLYTLILERKNIDDYLTNLVAFNKTAEAEKILEEDSVFRNKLAIEFKSTALYLNDETKIAIENYINTITARKFICHQMITCQKKIQSLSNIDIPTEKQLKDIEIAAESSDVYFGELLENMKVSRKEMELVDVTLKNNIKES